LNIYFSLSFTDPVLKIKVITAAWGRRIFTPYSAPLAKAWIIAEISEEMSKFGDGGILFIVIYKLHLQMTDQATSNPTLSQEMKDE